MIRIYVAHDYILNRRLYVHLVYQLSQHTADLPIVRSTVNIPAATQRKED